MSQVNSVNLAWILSQSIGQKDRETLDGHIAVEYLPAIESILDSWVNVAQLQGMTQKGWVKIVRHARWVASDGLARNARGGSVCDAAISMVSVIVALTPQKTISFHDAHALGGGSQEGATQVAGVSRARLHRVAPELIRRASGTLSAQYSRTVGKSGIFGNLGITAKSSAHGFDVIERNHPLVIMTADVLNRLSDTTIVELLG